MTSIWKIIKSMSKRKTQKLNELYNENKETVTNNDSLIEIINKHLKTNFNTEKI